MREGLYKFSFELKKCVASLACCSRWCMNFYFGSAWQRRSFLTKRKPTTISFRGRCEPNAFLVVFRHCTDMELRLQTGDGRHFLITFVELCTFIHFPGRNSREEKLFTISQILFAIKMLFLLHVSFRHLLHLPPSHPRFRRNWCRKAFLIQLARYWMIHYIRT